MLKKILLACLSVMSVSRDINNYPRDRLPDAGAFEYREKTLFKDFSHRIGDSWLSDNPNGDFNKDYTCDFKDYAIWVEWWEKKNGN